MERGNFFTTLIAGRPLRERRLWRSGEQMLRPTRRYRWAHKMFREMDKNKDEKNR